MADLVTEIQQLSGTRLHLDVHYPDDPDVEPTVAFLVERYAAVYFLKDHRTRDDQQWRGLHRTTCGD